MKLKTPIALNNIAQMVQAELIGDADFLLTGINEIHKVEEGDLTFCDHPKYYKKALTSAASVILINDTSVENPHNKHLLYSKDPFRDYNFLVQHFCPFEANTHRIHPSAQIDKSSILMQNVVVGQDSKIGKNCIIHPNVTIYNRVEIGDNVIIHANAIIGADAFYYQKREEGYVRMHTCGRVLIKDHVEIGAGSTVDKGVSGDTIIGKGTKLDNQVHIGHGCVIGEHCLLAAQVGIAGKTIVGNYVNLWGQVGVSKSLHIGDHTNVLAKSGVHQSLEGGKNYFGIPVEEAPKKMRQLALLKQLPDMWRYFLGRKDK